MGVVKSTYEFQLNLSQAIQMFLHRDQFHCVQIHTYAEAENTLPKRFNKQLPILKVKKSGGFRRGAVRIRIILAYRYQPWRLILVLRNK